MPAASAYGNYSLVRRVTFALTALVSVAVLALCFSAYEAHKKMGEHMVDHLVETEALRLKKKLSLASDRWDPAFERQLGPSMHAWGEHSARLAASMPPALRALPLGLSHLRPDASTWHVMVVDAKDGRLYVLYDSSDLEALTHDFGLALLAIALVFVVLSYLCARQLAKWVVHPIRAVTSHLSRWAPGRPQMSVLKFNEGAQLTEAFNRMQDRIDQVLADQKEFSSNFNHEIRRPLSLIRTDAELGKREAASAPKAALRFERIMRSADQMAGSLEATYHLAQSDHGVTEDVSVLDSVDDVFATAEAEASARGLELHNLVDKTQLERLNRHMLLTVIRNIVRNAIAHAAPGKLEISSLEHGLLFRDDGPGVCPSDAPHLFDRYYSGRRLDLMAGDKPVTPGQAETGLGLAIAKRACAIQGWSLELVERSENTDGAAFMLLFQPAAFHDTKGYRPCR